MGRGCKRETRVGNRQEKIVPKRQLSLGNLWGQIDGGRGEESLEACWREPGLYLLLAVAGARIGGGFMRQEMTQWSFPSEKSKYA